LGEQGHDEVIDHRVLAYDDPTDGLAQPCAGVGGSSEQSRVGGWGGVSRGRGPGAVRLVHGKSAQLSIMGELRGARSGVMGGRVYGPATTIITRPPPGPARGSLAAPSWLVVALTLALIVLSSYALWRVYRRRQK
jgi:hypothetical protein